MRSSGVPTVLVPLLLTLSLAAGNRAEAQVCNRGPIASADQAVVTSGSVLIDFLANDSDPDGDPLTVTVPGVVPGLTLHADGSATYTPPAGTSGPVSFGYEVSDGRGGHASATVTVFINATPGDAPPSPSFTASCTGLTCSFDASASSDDLGIAAYEWSFGDNTTASGVTASHAYSASGTYTVTLRVTDTGGQSVATSRDVVADAPPVASFFWTCNGRTCSFDGRGSTDDGGITSYSWSFGDGGAATGSLATHTYDTGGSFPVSLTVTDTGGQEAVTTRTVVIDAAPTASFVFTCAGRDCSFDATSSSDDAGIVAYAWDFGDASFASGVTASHTYAASGTFTVLLKVTDTAGQTDTTGRLISIDLPPVPSFTVSCAQRTCSFDASGSSDDLGIVGYAWDFGDGASGSGIAVTHTYAASGTFQAALAVTDTGGQSATASQAVVIDLPPMPSFTVSCAQRTCSFDASGSSDDLGIVGYTWNFGDGASGSGVAVTRAYAASGTFQVVLTVTDTGGQSTTAGQAVVIDLPPSASFTFDCPSLDCDFDGSGSSDDNGVASWSWDFGDGTTASGASVHHEYAQEGDYAVTLTVADALGQTDSTQQTVQVTDEELFLLLLVLDD